MLNKLTEQAAAMSNSRGGVSLCSTNYGMILCILNSV